MKTITATLALLLSADLLAAVPPKAGGNKPAQAVGTLSAKASVSAKPGAKKPCAKAAQAGKGQKARPRTAAKKPSPSACLKAAAKQAAFLGVKMAPAASSKLPGVRVAGVFPGSSAAKAGLKSGDVIRKLNDQIIRNPGQLVALVRACKPGELVTLAVANARSDKLRQVKAKLGAAPRDLHARLESRKRALGSEKPDQARPSLLLRSGSAFRLGADGKLRPTEHGKEGVGVSVDVQVLTPDGLKKFGGVKALEDLGISIDLETLLDQVEIGSARSGKTDDEVETLRRQVKKLTEEVQRLRRRIDEK